MSKGKNGDVIIRETAHIWVFWCPGCACAHGIDDTKWEFNKSTTRPTISPSIKVEGGGYGRICHSFVEDGMIRFLEDSNHLLKGQTAEIPEWPYLERKDS